MQVKTNQRSSEIAHHSLSGPEGEVFFLGGGLDTISTTSSFKNRSVGKATLCIVLLLRSVDVTRITSGTTTTDLKITFLDQCTTTEGESSIPPLLVLLRLASSTR